MTPAYANVMPKLQARFAENRFVVKTEQGAHHYRLLGTEITAPLPPSTPSDFNVFALVEFGERGQWDINQVPRDLTIDRCYIHGNEELNLRNGISLHSARTNIINSYISECHSTPAEGSESRAIWGSSGPGPYKIINNYLEAATENILFGGETTHFIPSDIEIRRNHLFKPLAWRASGRWSVKNLLELKQARRVTIDGNILENCWLAGQVGFAVLFTVYGSDVIEDVTFSNNIVRHAAFGIQFKNDGARSKRITVRNNVFEDINGLHWFGPNESTAGHFLTLDGGMDGLTVDHNTVLHDGSVASASGTETNKKTTNFVFTNNLMAHNAYGVRGSGANITSGNSTLQAYFPNYVFLRNVIAGANLSDYPANNFYPTSLDDALFVDRLAEDYRLSAFSDYRNQGTDGKDIGCDILQLHAAVGIPNGPGNLIMWGVGRGTHGYKYPYEPYLSWTDNSSDEEGFIIERKTGSNAYQLIYTEVARVGANVTTYPMSSLGNGGPFRVRAVNARGRSIVSNPVENYSY